MVRLILLSAILLSGCSAFPGRSAAPPDTDDPHVLLGEQARSLMQRMERLAYERRLNIQERHDLSDIHRSQLEALVSELNAELVEDAASLPGDFVRLAEELDTSVTRLVNREGSLNAVQAVCTACHQRYRSTP